MLLQNSFLDRFSICRFYVLLVSLRQSMGSQRDMAEQLNWMQYNNVFLQTALCLDFHLSEICKKLRENCDLCWVCWNVSDREGCLSSGSWGDVQFSLLFSACVVTVVAAKLTAKQLQCLLCYFRIRDGAGTSLIAVTVVKFCAESGFCNCCIRYLIYVTDFNKVTQNVKFGKGLSNSGTCDLLEWKSLSHVRLCNPMEIQSMGFFRPEYWSG